MNIREIHRNALSLVKDAYIYLDNGDMVGYQDKIKEAFELEKMAAIQLKDMYENEPTRSVLYRSAANLAFILNDYDSAYSLIIEALKGNPFNELKLELGNLLSEVIYRMEHKGVLDNQFLNTGYLVSLREESVPIKMEEKSGKYGGGFVISHLIEFLKNLQASYYNYAEIKFNRALENYNVKNIDTLKSNFLVNCNLIGVNLNFKSFGVDVVAEKSFMNPPEINNKDFKEMKQNLFSNFKQDVLYPEYNDELFQKEIEEKFDAEERKKIFSPIINSISTTKKYTISITEKNHTKKIKEFKPLTPKAKKIFKPQIEVEATTVLDVSLTKKIEQNMGNKKKVLVNEQLKHAEFEIVVQEINAENKKIIFNNAHTIVVIFDSSSFSISDDLYEVEVISNDYDNVLDSYNKLFIDKYSSLIDRRKELSISDDELLSTYESTTIRDW